MQKNLTLKPGRKIRLPSFDFSHTFTAFQYRNYRLWFIGQLASLFGTWMQSTAEGFLIYELTHSAAYLGIVGFANGIPAWLFMLYGGVISDRMPRRKLLVITQSVMMALALILAGLTFSGAIQPWHIILLAFLLGIANAFDAPARMAFISELVERPVMGNAIALNSGMYNIAIAVGPALAGLTYAWLGPAWCFTLNGISFIFVIIALLMMRMQPFTAANQRTSALGELRDGLNFVAMHSSVRALILIVGAATLLGISHATLLPEWAVDVLHGGVTINGLMLSARGLGALGGALMIASLGAFRFHGKLLNLGLIILPLSLMLFSVIRWAPLALLALVAVGWGWIVTVNLCNILTQSLVSDELRGRVMGIFSLTFQGTMPIGALLVGSTAEWIGSPITIFSAAALLFLFAWWVWLRMPQVRRLE
jgi:predicted MFS family arabinose efflux permease